MAPSADRLDLEDPLLAALGDLADERGTEAYIVGGWVRDRLRGRPCTDRDILVIGDGVAFAHAAARRLDRPTVVVHERFRTAMIPLGDGKLEFVGARREQYDPASRNPAVAPGTLEEDLARRDFTVNAIAVGLHGAARGCILDPHGGRQDIAAGILRTPLDPGSTFGEDPLRMLRAVRFAAQLGYRIAPPAREAIGLLRDRITIVSQERITEEFMKILAAERPSAGLLLLQDTGLLALVFPEVAQMAGVDQRREHHHKDVFLHTATVVDNVARVSEDVWLRFVALVHDIAKPRTKAFREGIGWTFHGHEEAGARMMKGIFRRLRLPLEKLPYVEKLVRLHLRPMALVDSIVTDSAVRRLVFDAGNDIDDLMKLCRADITSKNPRLVERYLRNYDLVLEKIVEVEARDRLRNWQPPVKGDEIMAVCGLREGRQVGMLKEAIEEAILEGTIPNEHDAALAYLLRIKDEILARPPEPRRPRRPTR